MITTFPSELRNLLREPKTIALISDGDHSNDCPNCHSAGVLAVFKIKSGPYRTCPGVGRWLDIEGKPGWYIGETTWGNCPACRGGQMQSYLERNCGLEGSDLQVSFFNFDPMPGKETAKETCQALLGGNQHPEGFVTLWGGYGHGKTHLLKAIVNGFRGINVTSHYSMLSDLLAGIREKFGSEHGGIQTEAVIEEYRHMSVLCVDEVNGVNLTSWALETINRLLDHRYTHRSEYLTVMALNLEPDALPVEMQYLASRMKEGVVLEVGGVDVREVKTKGGGR